MQLLAFFSSRHAEYTMCYIVFVLYSFISSKCDHTRHDDTQHSRGQELPSSSSEGGWRSNSSLEMQSGGISRHVVRTVATTILQKLYNLRHCGFHIRQCSGGISDVHPFGPSSDSGSTKHIHSSGTNYPSTEYGFLLPKLHHRCCS